MSYYNNAYGYNPYQFGYQQPQNQQQFYQSQMVQQQVPQQQNFIPCYYINGEASASAFNMQPNSTIFLKDSDSDLFFVKTSDAQCRCMIDKYRLVKVNNAENQVENKPNFDVSTLVTKTDLETFKNEIMAKLGGVDDEK